MNNHAVFFPQLRVKPVNPRASTVRPYFPGYIFVHADISLVGISRFQYLPHALGLVSFGGVPAEVPGQMLRAIVTHLEAINSTASDPLAGMKAGDYVEIRSGPFAGYEALFDRRLRDGDRVRVLLQMLGDRQVMVELRAGQIQLRRTR